MSSDLPASSNNHPDHSQPVPPPPTSNQPTSNPLISATAFSGSSAIKPQPQKSIKGFLIVIIFFVLVLSLGAGGYYLYQTGVLDSLNISDYFGQGKSSNIAPKVTPTTAETPQTVPNDTITPTPLPTVVLPPGWQTSESQSAGLSISHPSNWLQSDDCVSTSYLCITSEDFQGTITDADTVDVKQGMAIFIYRDFLPAQEDTQIADWSLLDDCKQKLSSSPSDSLLCQTFSYSGRDFVIYKKGEYQTVIGGNRYIINVYPSPPSPFSLLKQIFGSLRPLAVAEQVKVNVNADDLASPPADATSSPSIESDLQKLASDSADINDN